MTARVWGVLKALYPSCEDIELTETRTVIGRAKKADVRYKSNRALSSLHCVLEKNDQGVVSLMDTSSNGTYVNGIRIEKDKHVILHPGMQVILVKPDDLSSSSSSSSSPSPSPAPEGIVPLGWVYTAPSDSSSPATPSSSGGKGYNELKRETMPVVVRRLAENILALPKAAAKSGKELSGAYFQARSSYVELGKLSSKLTALIQDGDPKAKLQAAADNLDQTLKHAVDLAARVAETGDGPIFAELRSQIEAAVASVSKCIAPYIQAVKSGNPSSSSQPSQLTVTQSLPLTCSLVDVAHVGARPH